MLYVVFARSLRGLGVVSTFGNGYSIFKVQLRLCITFIFRLTSPRKNKKPLCINTNHRRERLALASNQMLIHNGFELIQKTILFVSTQLHLKQYKKFTVASHGFPKRDHRRYSGLVPNYTSTRTSYSVVVPLQGDYIISQNPSQIKVFTTGFENFSNIGGYNTFYVFPQILKRERYYCQLPIMNKRDIH